MKQLLQLFLVAILVLPLFSVQAQRGIAPYLEYRKRVEMAQNISPLDVGLFGEQVSLYNGSTVFSVTDIDVPGNSEALSLRLARQLAIELQPQGNFSFYDSRLLGAGNWDVDVPYMVATYATNAGMPLCSQGIQPTYLGGFKREEVWQGVQVHVPGERERRLLGIGPLPIPRPANANTYRYSTVERDVFDCIALPGGAEGFRMTTKDGLKYYFTVATSRTAAMIRKRVFESAPTPGDNQIITLARSRYYLLASKIEDRLGNTIQYSYNGNGHPTRIWSNDGREILLTYTNGRLASASTSGRTWQYQYSQAGNDYNLSTVVLPDASKWQYAYAGSLKPYWSGIAEVEQWAFCDTDPLKVNAGYGVTATHPSGATGQFMFINRRHYRSGVAYTECEMEGTPPNDVVFTLRTPHFFDVMSLKQKTIGGPGIQAPLAWVYDFGSGFQSLFGVHGQPTTYPCTTCDTEKTISLTHPDGTQTRHRFGIQYWVNEGRVLGTQRLAANGDVMRTETVDYLTEALAPSQGFYDVYGGGMGDGSDPSMRRVRPETRRIITQQGSTFTTSVPQCGAALCFDAFARPTSETKSSSLGYSRTDTTEYHDDLNAWVLGQVKRTTTNGIETARTDFDARSQPWRQYAFGKLQHTLTYHADGSLATATDGNGNTTTLTNWKRGIPQSIQHADGTTESAVVSNAGWITSTTDENGFASHYGYDAMGRMTSLFYPAGDSTAWNPVSMSFQQVPHADRGLPAGHWRHDRFEGNRHTHTYYDALWRPVMTLDYDVASAGHNVQTQTVTRYDTQGRVVFQSYPARHVTDVNANLPGTRTQYDALDRVTRVEQDSEHGRLVTTTEYLPGNSVKTTNPRGHATTNHYAAYDQPAYDELRWSAQPEGRTLEIHRDVFGKPLWIRQRAADNSISATRHYVYDAHQQLCKTIEPETGATVMGLDAAGNLAWSASGLNLPSTTDCNFNEAWYSGRRSDRSYDTRNRLSALAFADGHGNQQWQYTPDGLPAQITTYNTPGGGTPVINAYAYNRRRLLTGESITQPGWYTWSLGYGYNANGQLASQTYPDGFALTYSLNALGQPTEVRDTSGKAYASNVSYYPNGGISGFTYGNGVVHGMTQNARQLPARSTDNGVMDYGFAYDQNANPVHVADHLQGTPYSRWMTYDGLDRLTDAGSASFGGDHWHRFGYNALDNLTSWKLAGVKDHAQYVYDANNRLTNIRNSAGATVVGLGYDVQGNLQNKNGQAYTFDMGNRLREVPGKEYYRYDGHGRRVLAWIPGSGSILSFYGNTGQMLYNENFRSGYGVSNIYIYLQGSLLAHRERPYGTTNIPVVKYQHTDALGSPVAVTNEAGQVIERTQWEPYGAAIGKPAYDGPGYTGHVMDGATGLTYMQQRYYDPQIGRFLSVDPVTALSGGQPHFNRYWYASNNPYKFKDPDGRAVETVWDVANIAIGVASFGKNVATGNYVGAAVDAVGIVVDSAATVVPGVPGGAGATIKAVRGADAVAGAAKASNASGPYKRPSNATTLAQRESVQGKPCVKCGAETPRQVAGHKEALVKEHHQTGSINRERMRSVDAVQPECRTCSAREGAEMSRYSREMNQQFKKD